MVVSPQWFHLTGKFRAVWWAPSTPGHHVPCTLPALTLHPLCPEENQTPVPELQRCHQFHCAAAGTPEGLFGAEGNRDEQA